MKCLVSAGHVYRLSDVRYRRYLKEKRDGVVVDLGNFGTCLGAVDDVTNLSPKQAGERFAAIEEATPKPPKLLPLATVVKSRRTHFAAVARLLGVPFEIRPLTQNQKEMLTRRFNYYQNSVFLSRMINEAVFVHMTAFGRSIITWVWTSDSGKGYRLYNCYQQVPRGEFTWMSHNLSSSPEEIARDLRRNLTRYGDT